VTSRPIYDAIRGGVSQAPRGAASARQRAVLHAVTEVLHSFATPAAQLAVLDCGGGSGGLAVPLAQLGCAVTVVDISGDALATLTRRAADAGVAHLVHPVQGDLEALGDAVAASGFDLVLLHGVLEFVDPLTALRSAAAATRPGGVISVLVANPVATVLAKVLAGDISSALVALRSREPTSRTDAATLGELCTSLGLDVEQVHGVGVFAELAPAADPDSTELLAELEELAAGRSPYREIASRVHLVARRPITSG
jgi:S-adenosylmethionine-dependent methyltransferase